MNESYSGSENDEVNNSVESPDSLTTSKTAIDLYKISRMEPKQSSPLISSKTTPNLSSSTSPLLQNTNAQTSPDSDFSFLQKSNINPQPTTIFANSIFSNVLQNFESFNPPETYQKFIASISYLIESYKKVDTLTSVIYRNLKNDQSSSILKQVITGLQSDLELAIFLAQNLLQELLNRIDYNNNKLKDHIFQAKPEDSSSLASTSGLGTGQYL